MEKFHNDWDTLDDRPVFLNGNMREMESSQAGKVSIVTGSLSDHALNKK